MINMKPDVTEFLKKKKKKYFVLYHKSQYKGQKQRTVQVKGN